MNFLDGLARVPVHSSFSTHLLGEIHINELLLNLKTLLMRERRFCSRLWGLLKKEVRHLQPSDFEPPEEGLHIFRLAVSKSQPPRIR